MSDIVKYEAVALEIDKAIENGLQVKNLTGTMAKAFGTATAISKLRELLTDEIMQPIMALQGSTLGFKTDKDKDGGYPVKVVRECFIEALLNGLGANNNVFNIIASRMYITKEGMGVKLDNIEGLSYLITAGIPKALGAGAVVEMTVEWTYQGKSDKRVIPIMVKLNQGMGEDGAIGKAERKARAWLYRAVTHSEIPDGEADVAVPQPKTSPFEKAKTEAVDAEVVDPPKMDEAEERETLLDLIDSICVENEITKEMILTWSKNVSPERLPLSTLRKIAKEQDRWVKAVKK